VSHLLASLFSAFLCASLSIAFTQHLWQIMRIASLKLSTIDRLFKIRQNFLFLGNPVILQSAPLLSTLALLVWLIPVAVILPPGALTVVPFLNSTSQNAIVPRLNLSFVGNGSYNDYMRSALYSDIFGSVNKHPIIYFSS
jgi:hypothetical protein